jgi:hypothetical protein
MFHFRHSLGMVTYHLDSLSMSHQEYMRSVIGRPNASHYPGFSDDPMDAFRHLQLDLEEHYVDFLEGSDENLHLLGMRKQVVVNPAGEDRRFHGHHPGLGKGLDPGIKFTPRRSDLAFTLDLAGRASTSFGVM